MTKALVFEELKGRAIALDGIQSSIAEGSGLTIAIKPEDVAEKINDLGNRIEQEKKQRQSAAQKNVPALFGYFLVCMQAPTSHLRRISR